MSSSKLKWALLASSASVLLAAPAWAQSTSGSTLGEVVVTARRVQERIQDVPISITVYNQEQLAKQNIVNLGDLALYTPSLGTQNVLSNNQTTFSLRGFNQELTTSPTVAVFFADVVAPRGAANQQPVGDGAGPGSFFDLQNLQVLKGPQGTLFGRNTTGGAILLVPKKPTDRTEGYIEGSYGNYDMWRVQGVFNAPVTDTFRIRAGVDRQQRRGFVTNTSGIGPRHFNNVNYIAGRLSAVWDVTPDVENYSIGSYALSNTHGEVNGVINAQTAADLTIPGVGTIPGAIQAPFAFLAQQDLTRRANAGFYSFENNMPDPYNRLEQWQLINTTSWRQSDSLTVKNIVSYAQLKYDLKNPVVGEAFRLSDFNPYGQAFIDAAIVPRLPAGTPRPIFTPFPTGAVLAFTDANPDSAADILQHTAHQSTFTEELQFQGKAADNRLVWQSGVYFENSLPLGVSGSQTPNLLLCTNVETLTCANPFFGFGGIQINTSKKKIKTYGVYGQATYNLTDSLKLTAGARYTWDRSTASGRILAYSVPWNPFAGQAIQFATPVGPTCVITTASVANGCLETVNQRSKAPTWLLGLDYKPTNDILTYVKYSRGYRTGGISFQLPPAIRTYGPEKVDTYEAGLKLTNPGGLRGMFNVAAFYNDFRNQQIPIGVTPRVIGQASNATGVVNAGKSRIYGTEVETSLEVLPRFVVSASYSYINTKIKKLSYPTFNDPLYILDSSRSPRVGDQLSFSPRHKATLSANYTLPMDDSIGKVSVGAAYSYSSRQITNYFFRQADGTLGDYSWLKSRNLVDANVTWTDLGGKGVDVQLFANNILQKHYYTYILDVASRFQTAQLGTPRMYGVRVRYSFGQ